MVYKPHHLGFMLRTVSSKKIYASVHYLYQKKLDESCDSAAV